MKRKQRAFSTIMFIGILAIIMPAIILTGCKPQKSDEVKALEARLAELEAASATQGLPAHDSTKILKGDLSEFAGIWVNGAGERRELKPDGFFSGVGISREGGVTVSGFHGEKVYQWSVRGYEWGGFDVSLYPVGVDIEGLTGVSNDGEWIIGILQTDKTKVRMATRHGTPLTADDIYYLEKEFIPTKKPETTTVYVAGIISEHPNYRAAFWRNGVEYGLENEYSGAYSVFVSGSDVYVAGNIGNTATLWKNSIAQSLGEGSLSSVFVSGSDVYVAGDVDGKATLWKNGKAQTLRTQQSSHSHVNSVYVSGSDVYVAGTVDDKATLWKNGRAQTLSDEWSSANSVFVSGSDVYVAGNLGRLSRGASDQRATLWKNGKAQTMTTQQSYSHANSVFVSGSDIYVAGHEGMHHGQDIDMIATLWKNGNAQTLGELYTTANSVYVSGSDAYVVGGPDSKGGILWINGKAQILSDKTYRTSSVFVVRK